MIKKILFNIVTAAFIFIGISFLSFSLMYIAPSDPAEIMLSSGGIPVNEQTLEAKREEMGLNKPFYVQYFNWLKRFMAGDLGNSLSNKKPVFDEILSKLPATILLAVLSLAITLSISIPLGTICAVKKNQFIDSFLRVISFVGISLPSFFISLLLMYFFSIRLHLLPVIGNLTLKNTIMPTAVLVISMSSKYIRQIRGVVLEELNKDYVDGLRSRGLHENQIIIKHVLKNSMLPIVTLIGISLGGLFGGTAIVESIFSWPGVGKLAVDAITKRDYPVIQGYVIWMALTFIVVNFLVEISYSLLNPQIRRMKVGNANENN